MLVIFIARNFENSNNNMSVAFEVGNLEASIWALFLREIKNTQ